MKPVNFEYANDIIGKEIPVNRTHGMLISIWQGTWRERFMFLLTGKAVLCVKGDVMPATLLSTDKLFRIENPPDIVKQGQEMNNQPGGVG